MFNFKAGSEADGVNSSKTKETSPALESVLSSGAVPPTFKRKRSFWRAVRRGEFWAIFPYSMQNLMQNLEADIYGIKIGPQNVLFDRHVPSDLFYLMRKNSK